MNQNYCKSGSCVPYWIAKVLLVVGGLNWGLVGLGTLLGGSGWNVVNMLLGGVPVLESVVYLLVGVSAVVVAFGCRCGTCMSCATCGPAGTSETPSTTV